MNDTGTEKQETGSDSAMLHVGLDAGSVSLNCVVVDSRGEIVSDAPYARHMGKVEAAVANLLETLFETYGPERIRSISFTGNHGKKLSESTGAFYEFETISEVLGALHLQPDVRSIISMGGQDTALLQVRHEDAAGSSQTGAWELAYFNTNGPCASGTGSFIDQQAQRLATSIYSEESRASRERIDKILEDFIDLGLQSEHPANVACRCTVFTKSDMIHLQNKGELLEDIIYGLHIGNARNYMSTIVSDRTLEYPILFIGGLSLNALQVKAFKNYFPKLIVPHHSTSIGALGVALQAMEMGWENRVDLGTLRSKGTEALLEVPVAPRLKLDRTAFPEANEVSPRPQSGKRQVYLGIDIGSTTTKYALMDNERQIVHKSYVHTRGKPIEVTQQLLSKIRRDLGDHIEIMGTATTGSGRNVVGDFLNVDLILDEITAHARGAVEIDPEVDTIFEIGGQDSKYIYIANTYPLDFDMNKVCAAGTGSFLHELANKYGIGIVGEFQKIAMSSEQPVKLAERCTVFMESDLVSYHQKGADEKDLIAGLCYAIVYNYLNRVVEKRKIGRNVMFLGGPSLNKGVVAAFENVLGRGLIVPRHREVLGAYGAAISVQEKMTGEDARVSRFRGLDSAISDQMNFSEKVCAADPNCHNQCKLKIYDFDGRRSVWGGECGRYEHSRSRGSVKENAFEARDLIWREYMDGVYQELGNTPLPEADGRPTVGMQRSLYGMQGSVLWAHFFDRLGMRLVLTPPTNSAISREGIETMTAEACYPVKVSHGHVKALLGKTKYLFLPNLIDMSTPGPEETGYFCPMVQGNSYMVRSALAIHEASLLSPVIHLKYDRETLALALYEQVKPKLRVTRKQVRHALFYALDQEARYIRDLYQKGKEFLGRHDPCGPLVVVTGRPYNLYDERLNLRLGKNLAKIGVSAVPMDFLDVSAVDLTDFPSMYWGLGAQILRTAKYVKANACAFGLHLTNFSCGADSFLEHFYRHIMGDKAYLILELDEHSAVAGVMTRLEAFRNVIENAMGKTGGGALDTLKLAN